MSIKYGISRQQIRMYCLDDEIEKNSEARLIDAFVNWINLDDYRFVTKGKSKEGQPAYSVKDMLKLYFYRSKSSKGLFS